MKRVESTASDEQHLIDKLRKIEMLHARTPSRGERAAAGEAADRVRQRLDDLRAHESVEPESMEPQSFEFKFTFPDAWAKSLFVALVRRHGLRPYRYARQRRTTVMVRAPRDLIDDELWPEFSELHSTLHLYLGDVTRRIIATAIHGDGSEPDVVANAQQLPQGEL